VLDPALVGHVAERRHDGDGLGSLEERSAVDLDPQDRSAAVGQPEDDAELGDPGEDRPPAGHLVGWERRAVVAHDRTFEDRLVAAREQVEREPEQPAGRVVHGEDPPRRALHEHALVERVEHLRGVDRTEPAPPGHRCIWDLGHRVPPPLAGSCGRDVRCSRA
jgi:hypothetical protein